MERVSDKTEQVSLLSDFIMKNCLWQFHSRTWDRQRQNDNILGMTKDLLLGKPVNKETAEDRCYYVDALYLVESFKEHFPWISTLSNQEIDAVMDLLKAHIDYVTITGSLNEELTDEMY